MLLAKYILYYSRVLRLDYRRLLNRLLPASCVFCGTPSTHAKSICTPCHRDLPILTQHCRQCAQVLPNNSADQCGACLKQAKPYDATFALFTYDPPIVRLITALKFERQLAHAAALSELFLHKINTEWYTTQMRPHVLIPTPLHTQRLCERGYNQAVEIARPLARRLNMPLDIHGVTRIKNTRAQSGLSATARQQNLSNAFRVHHDYTGQCVALLDDVVTTGHTVAAIAHALKQAGAKTIHIWCAAKTQTRIAENTKTGYHHNPLTSVKR